LGPHIQIHKLTAEIAEDACRFKKRHRWQHSWLNALESAKYLIFTGINKRGTFKNRYLPVMLFFLGSGNSQPNFSTQILNFNAEENLKNASLPPRVVIDLQSWKFNKDYKLQPLWFWKGYSTKLDGNTSIVKDDAGICIIGKKFLVNF